jgi:hypothetical protein
MSFQREVTGCISARDKAFVEAAQMLHQTRIFEDLAQSCRDG